MITKLEISEIEDALKRKPSFKMVFDYIVYGNCRFITILLEKIREFQLNNASIRELVLISRNHWLCRKSDRALTQYSEPGFGIQSIRLLSSFVNTLHHLDLSGNALGKKNIILLLDNINSPISLYLRRCNIDQNTADLIAIRLICRQNTISQIKLKKALIDVYYNNSYRPSNLSPLSLHRFIYNIQSRTTRLPITSLDIRGNHIKSYRLFDIALAYNTTLSSLNLGAIQDTDFRCLKYNNTLKQLEMNVLGHEVSNDVIPNISSSRLERVKFACDGIPIYGHAYELDTIFSNTNISSICLAEFPKNLLLSELFLQSTHIRQLSLTSRALTVKPNIQDFSEEYFVLRKRFIDIFTKLELLKLFTHKSFFGDHFLRYSLAPVIIDAIIETLKLPNNLRDLRLQTDMHLEQYKEMCSIIRYNTKLEVYRVDFTMTTHDEVKEAVHASNAIFNTNKTLIEFELCKGHRNHQDYYKAIANYAEKVKRNRYNAKRNRITLFRLLAIYLSI